MKKRIAIYTALMLLLLFSCKSQKDVSRSAQHQARGESLVTETDSTAARLEASQTTDMVGNKEENSYTKETEFDSVGNVSKITETYVNSNLQFDFSNQLTHLDLYDHSKIGTTQTTTTQQGQEVETDNSTTDSRLIQGWDWLLVVVGVIALAGYFIGGCNLYKKIRR